MDIISKYKVTRKGEGESPEILTVVQEYDDYPESPRTFYDNDSTFITFESRHASPDKCEFHSCSDWADANGFDMGTSHHDLIASMEKKGFIAIPVWRYEHSGVAYEADFENPFYDEWDSGMVGVIYISKKDALDMCGSKRMTAKAKEMVVQILKAEVDIYSFYANGEVYRYSLCDSNGDVIESLGCSFGECKIEDIFKEFGVCELAVATA